MIITGQLEQRILKLLDFWGTPESGPITAPAFDRLCAALESDPSLSRAWETLAALRLTVPTRNDVYELTRSVTFGGARIALESLEPPVNASGFGETTRALVVREGILADVHITVETSGTTGIQRVARETVRRWISRGVVTPVAWSEEHRALRLLSRRELDSLMHTEPTDPVYEVDEVVTLVVPLGGTLIVPELAIESWRTKRLGSIGQFASTRLTAIGFDTVPVTSTETAAPPIAERFPRYLDALAWADRLAAISESAAIEFRGWRRMLVGSGRGGPEIESVFLAAEVSKPEPDELQSARLALGADDVPLVLVVGSHEPRKNHLAILHAAELLWREGLGFQLCFVGGNAWGNERFDETVSRLQAAGRAVSVRSAVSDGFLAAAYALARFTVFPSLNEGFGLPVVESIAAGTPVITSRFGSMKEIADAFGGVLTVDPRDDSDLVAKMRDLLTRPELVSSLQKQTEAARPKTWDEYSLEVFAYLTGSPITDQIAAA